MLVLFVGCVSAPQAQRSGGTACTQDSDCNPGAQCGNVSLCITGYCTVDTTFRACAGGEYPDAGGQVGQCITYLNCNTASCGLLVPCVSGQCAPGSQPLSIPCEGDAGEGDAQSDAETDAEQ